MVDKYTMLKQNGNSTCEVQVHCCWITNIFDVPRFCVLVEVRKNALRGYEHS